MFCGRASTKADRIAGRNDYERLEHSTLPRKVGNKIVKRRRVERYGCENDEIDDVHLRWRPFLHVLDFMLFIYQHKPFSPSTNTRQAMRPAKISVVGRFRHTLFRARRVV